MDGDASPARWCTTPPPSKRVSRWSSAGWGTTPGLQCHAPLTRSGAVPVHCSHPYYRRVEVATLDSGYRAGG